VTSPIDVAYVDIVVRDKSLAKLEKDLDKTFKQIDKDIEQDLKKIDDNVDDVFDKINKHFTDTQIEAERSFNEISESVEKSFKDVDEHVDKHSKRTKRAFTDLGDEIGDTFEEAGEHIERGFRRIFSNVGDGLKNIGTTFGQLGGALGGAVTGSPLLALILALVPAIIALAAALAQLIGLVGIIPAGLGILVAAIIPAVVAFQNFGDAVSALASGDLEKIDEALKKLSPSARAVAREVAGLLPVLKEFQRGVQDAFFRQVGGGFTQLVGILPKIEANFRGIAQALGTFVGQFVQFLASTNSVNTFNALFNTTAGIINRLSGPFIHLLDAIASTTRAGLPFVDRLVNALGRALDTFSAFINKSIDSGAFNEFVEDAIQTVKELIDLTKALGGLLGTIFTGTEESGHDFIKTLTDITVKLDEFFKSAEGQQTLKDLVFLVKALGATLAGTVIVLEFLVQQFNNSLRLLDLLGKFFVGLSQKVGEFFAQVPAKFNEFKAFLAQIPAIIGQAISLAFDFVLTTIGQQIGLILFAIQVLPGKIVDFFASLPQRIGDSLASTGPTLLDIFRKAMADLLNFIIIKFGEVVLFIQSVPDRIVALGPVFLRAGKNLITSFMNGFRSVGSFIGDVAGDIVSSVKSFLNRAIDKINSGIASIDAVLPGSLARIPRLAAGALVGRRPGGTLAVVGEGREDEVVAPLSKLEDIIRKAFGGDPGAGGMTVNFGPGSISISFGAVPTEGEARTTGRAVADGIASQLARRNVRTQVRAV
jgi:phage-related protein